MLRGSSDCQKTDAYAGVGILIWQTDTAPQSDAVVALCLCDAVFALFMINS